MIQRSPFSPTYAAESAPDDSSRTQHWFSRESARTWFQLPSSLQGYLVFLLCLLILAFTMILHVTLSAEILRLNVELGTLADESERIERHNANLVWLIAQRSSLTDAYKTARELEYLPITDVRFVVRPLGAPQIAAIEPSMSQFGALAPAEPSWWQRTWRAIQGAYLRAQDWVWDRAGW